MITYYPRVEVTWTDTRDENKTWLAPIDIKPELAIVRQVGFLISRGEGILTIAGALASDHDGVDVGLIAYIPLGCVTEVKEI